MDLDLALSMTYVLQYVPLIFKFFSYDFLLLMPFKTS